MSNPHYPWTSHYPAGLSWDGEVENFAVFENLAKAAAAMPDGPAFDFLGHKLTWGQLHDQALRVAKGLQDIGVGKGTQVGLLLPNCPYFVAAYYGIARTGATIVNYNPLYSNKELVHQIEDSQTDIMITADLALTYDKASRMLHDTRLKKLIVCKFTDILPFPKNILFKLVKGKDLAQVEESSRVVWYSDLIDNDARPSEVAIDPDNDIAVLQYTGGTTGVPKGAMLTHRNVMANTIQAANWVGTSGRKVEKMLGILPFFHVFAMTAVMNLAIRLRMEIIALPRFDLEQTLKLIHTKKPHVMPAVPAILNAINNHKKLEKYDLSSLEFCISGGAPLPVEVKKKFEEKTGSVVVEGYGLTEAAPVIACNVPKGVNKPGSIGLPFQGTVVEIINPDDKTTRMPMGERGELCASGPQVMKGYWNKPEETAAVLKDGLLYTGDIAIMDEEGYLFIVDRIKDLIITNGYNVYPRNVEEAIYLHSCVEECIVAGLPDANRGEIVKAWIKCKEGTSISIEDMKLFLKDKLSPMELPKQIEFRDQPLPKTMIGKLSRKDILAEEMGKK